MPIVEPHRKPQHESADQVGERRRNAITKADLENYRAEMFAHIDAKFDELEMLIKSGFPHGDVEAHRRVHEGFIAEASERASLWKAIREKTIVGGVWAVLMLLVAAIWEYIKLEVKK